MGLFSKLFGIVKYLLNFLKSSDFLKPVVEEYKLLEVTPLDLNFAVLIGDFIPDPPEGRIVKRLH